LTDYWLAFSSGPATNPANWSEIRLTDSSFDLEQAPSRTSIGFTASYFLGDYEGLAASGNDFVSVWGMPDGTGTSQEDIFYRGAMSRGPSSPHGDGLTAVAVNTAPTLAGPDTVLPGEPAFDRALAAGIGSGQLDQRPPSEGQLPAARPS